MMTSWPAGLVALACVAMVALMCLPMAVGMIHRRHRHGRGDTTGHPAGNTAGEPTGSPARSPSVEASGRAGQPPPQAPDLTRGEEG
jgi:hypothetical protein